MSATYEPFMSSKRKRLGSAAADEPLKKAKASPVGGMPGRLVNAIPNDSVVQSIKMPDSSEESNTVTRKEHNAIREKANGRLKALHKEKQVLRDERDDLLDKLAAVQKTLAMAENERDELQIGLAAVETGNEKEFLELMKDNVKQYKENEIELEVNQKEALLDRKYIKQLNNLENKNATLTRKLEQANQDRKDLETEVKQLKLQSTRKDSIIKSDLQKVAADRELFVKEIQGLLDERVAYSTKLQLLNGELHATKVKVQHEGHKRDELEAAHRKELHACFGKWDSAAKLVAEKEQQILLTQRNEVYMRQSLDRLTEEKEVLQNRLMTAIGSFGGQTSQG